MQRACRARLAAAGKVARIVDARAASDQDSIADMRERLRNTLMKLDLREQDVTRLQERNTYLERELKTLKQHLTKALKDNIVLKQQLARSPAGRARADRLAVAVRKAAGATPP